MSRLKAYILFNGGFIVVITILLVSCKDVGGNTDAQNPKETTDTKTVRQPLFTSEVPVSETKLVIIDSVKFSDNTELQIYKEEVDDSQECHSCSPTITLIRSFKDYKGNVTWKEATLNVTSSWGEPGRFYLDELKENQDLLFYQGGYSQGGNSYTWINAFRIDESFFGDLSWTFDFKTGLDQSSAYSIEECKSLMPDGLTPVEVRDLLDGELDITVAQERLHVHTRQKRYTSIYVEESEGSVELSPKTVKRDLYYSLEYGNVYLDSTYESRR